MLDMISCSAEVEIEMANRCISAFCDLVGRDQMSRVSVCRISKNECRNILLHICPSRHRCCAKPTELCLIDVIQIRILKDPAISNGSWPADFEIQKAFFIIDKGFN